MNNAAPPLTQIPLSSFLGLYTEASPEDLPEGVSPLTWDTDFVIGSVLMRPGIGSAFSFGGQNTGPRNCQAGNDVSLNLVPWDSPGNIVAHDGSYASAAPTPSAVGPKTAGTGASSGPGTAWTNPGNVSSNASFAVVALTAGTTSQFLQATNFAFGLPASFGGGIAGIAISARVILVGGSGNVTAQLLKNGVPTGDIKFINIVNQSGTAGGATDVWGATWLATDLNNASWGVQFQAAVGIHGGTWEINNVQATAYPLSGTDELVASNFGFTLPSQAVNGISIGITGHQAGAGSVTAQLVKAGVLVGQTRTATLAGADSRIVLGSSTDNWGAGLVPADINNPAFGVAITAAGAGTFFVDLVDCTTSQVASNLNYNWVKTYAQRNGQVSTLALDSSGVLHDEDVTNNPGVLNTIFTGILPGSFARSVTLDDVEYMAMSDLKQGFDMPRQWNGTNLDRISQVGPGSAPSINATTNGVSIVASPNGITQIAAITLPAAGNGTWVLWSASPGTHNPGNVLTFVFPNSFTLPAGFVNGAFVAIQNLPSMNGFNANSGAGSNPGTYQIFNVGGAIQGQSAYAGFSVLLSQTAYFSARVSGGAVTLQLSLATVTATGQVPNVQVGSQFTISGAGAAGWNGTWTCQATPNAAQLQITNTTLAGQTATYSYNLVTGAIPTVGQSVIITGCVNGNGIFNGTFVVQTASPTQFTVFIAQPNVGSAGESGQALIDGTIFQFEPQKIVSNSGNGTIGTTGAIGAGSRACVVLYLTRNGYLSAPSPYVQFSTTGSTTSLVVSQIAVGPSNVIARVIAFTGAQVTQIPGQIGNFFWIPAPVTVFDASAGQNVTFTATIINDNSTTQATFTFTDAVLLAASAIDVQGNNLFEQKELGPTLGCIAYGGRMHHWGELNKVTNLINMSFDGGSGVNSAIGNQGVGLSTTFPLGWTASDTFGSVIVNAIFGSSYYIKQTGATSPIGMLSQPACKDQYGVNILNPQTTYSVRLGVRSPSSATTGNLVIDLFSPSFNRIYGLASFPLSSLSSAFQLFTSTLLTTVFITAVTTDLQLRVYATGMTASEDVEIDRIEIFPTLQPVLSTQLTSSYVDNFEAFDQVTGVIDCSIQNQQPVRSGFTLFDTLYIVKSGCFLSTQDNGTTEPNGWTTRMVSNSVGTPSVNGVDFVDNQNQGESYALIAGRPGVYLFNGGEPVCVSGEIRSLWNLINWTYGHTLWIRNDQTNRRILVGVPLPTPNQWLPNAPVNSSPATPNVILAMSYKEVNSISELMDRSAVRASFTGKLIAPEISRKWSIWQIQSPYSDFVQRQNNTAPLFLGNSTGTGKVYQITEGRTDDDGAAINEFYTTYGFVKPDVEQAFQLTSTRKQFSYLTMVVSGNGSLGIKTIVDNLFTGYSDTLLPVTLPNPGGFDTELPLNETGARLFLQFSMKAVGSSFNLSRLVLAMQKETFTPVRGR